MKVIATVGQNGSGKDVLVDYLHARCDLPVFVVGDIVRELATEAGLAPTRENLHEISERYMQQYGRDCFVRRLIEKIRSRGGSAVGVSGIRTPAGVELLRKHFGRELLIVQVEVTDPATRFERLKRRNKPRDPDTYEQFRQQEKSEEELFHISQTIQKADVAVNNDGSLEDFHQKIEEALRPCSLMDEPEQHPKRRHRDGHG